MTTSKGSKATAGPHRPLLCRHDPTGVVAWPADYDPTSTAPRAAVYSCARRVCVRDAVAWVRERTGHDGVYRPNEVPEPQKRASATQTGSAAAGTSRRGPGRPAARRSS